MSKVVDNYILEEEIGTSQFCTMFKSRNIMTKEYVAIKVLKLDMYKRYPLLQQMITEEVQALKILDSKHIIKSLRFLRTSNNMYQVYEFFPRGNLKNLLSKQTTIPEKEALAIFKDIVFGLKALYEKNIIHQNMKPSNIFFRDSMAVIGDFNGCRILKSKYETLNGSNGLPFYLAPEILGNQNFDMRSDLYSLGVVLYEMLFGQKPYKSVNAKD
jgi:serine/threonine protein kinase